MIDRRRTSPQVEAELDGFGFEWELRTVSLLELTVDDEFQSRFGVIDRELTELYNQLYLGGAVFPALVAALFEGRLYVVDGRHRKWVLGKNGISEYPVYVFRAKAKEDIQEAAHYLNNLNGKQNSAEERLTWAVEAVMKGADRELAARKYGVSKAHINVRIRMNQHHIKRLRALGINYSTWKGLSETAIDRICGRAQDKALESALRTARIVGPEAVLVALGEANADSTTDAEKLASQTAALNTLMEASRGSTKGLLGNRRKRLRSQEELLYMSLCNAESTVIRALRVDTLSERNREMLLKIKKLLG